MNLSCNFSRKIHTNFTKFENDKLNFCQKVTVKVREIKSTVPYSTVKVLNLIDVPCVLKTR